MPLFAVEKGPLKGRTLALPPAGECTVGRDGPAQVALQDTLVSRIHFKIRAMDGTHFVADCGSQNGTFLNGERITAETSLKPGDQIQVGETVLSYVVEDSERKPVDPFLGQTVGGYRIIARVGRGGMGVVYRATQLSLNREVALKILSGKFVADKTFINMFVQEARSAAALNHPNIVQVYDVGKAKETWYFSMEYMGGGSVQDILVKEGRIAVGRALGMVLNSAKGLEFAEKKQIVHCDIKPDNLMLTEDGMVKIGDLGLSKNLQRGEGGGDAQVFGTPHFVAPEQVQGRPLDHRTDLYSLGATFYRMVAGRTPFAGETARELVMKHLKEVATPLVTVDPDIPPGVDAIVQRLMKKEPGERYQSATDLIEDLRKVMLEVGAEGGYTDLIPGVVGGGRRRRRRLMFMGVAAVALAGILGATIFGGGTVAPRTETPEEIALRQEKEAEAQRVLAKAKYGEKLQVAITAVYKLESASADKASAELEKVYRDFIAAYPDTPEAKEFGAKLAEIPGLRKTRGAEAASAEWTRLSERMAKAPPTDAELEADLQKFLATYSDSPHRGNALKWLDACKLARAELQDKQKQSAEHWSVLKPKVEALFGDEHFDAAKVALAEYPVAAFKGLPATREVEATLNAIPTRAKQTFDKRESDAKTHEAAGRLAEAIATYEVVVQRYGMTFFVQKAKVEIERLRAEEQRRATEATKAAKAADQAVLDKAAQAAAPLVARFQFAAALDIWEKVADGALQTAEGRAAVLAARRDLGHAAAAMKALVEALNSPGAKGKDIAIPAGAALKGEAKVESADAESVQVNAVPRGGGRAVRTKLQWTDFSGEELLAVVRRHVPAGPEAALQRVALGFLWSAGRDVPRDLDEADRATEPRLRADAAYYRARLVNTPIVDIKAEEEATKLMESARALIRQADQQPDIEGQIEKLKQAEELLERILKDFGSTKAARGAKAK